MSSGEITIFMGVPLFDAHVRGETPHPAAPKFLIRNQRLYAIIRWKPGVSIWPGLESVPGRDRQTEFPLLIRAL